MKWFNPLVWIGAVWRYSRAHFWAWNASSAWTWASTAFPLSMLYPNWARDLNTIVWPEVKLAVATAADLAVEFLNSS